ncbi:hypothetical protein HHK36_009282 [Tetracentron sinense]|uniref:Uncharacterized protein n=1 Tax=Tetracentron sinense TaxID=13715 RepID=A0A834ZCP3_TETSI|nr:hypothetical protein HHK36_009282 [Tetracentron sinense]
MWNFDIELNNNHAGSNEEGDVFFDSVDYLQRCDSMSSESSVSAKVELVCENLEYQVWRNEPGSVQERRERFLHGMGFSEFASSRMGSSQETDKDTALGSSSEILGLERITELNGAVSSSWASSINRVDEDLVCSRTNFMVGELGQDRSDRLTTAHDGETSIGLSPHEEEHDGDLGISRKKMRSWWKNFINKKGGRAMSKSEVSVTNLVAPKRYRTKVRYNRKRCMEFTALYTGQEIQAHKGFIWTMKFSPDGQYLATGGEDGVVRIWRVTSADASCENLTAEDTPNSGKNVKDILRRKNSNHASVVFPKKVFKIEESPLQECPGHTSDILDLSWSKSNCLLSSSKDKTVRLWQVGCNECLNVFHHSNYVTCIQFNPVDDGYFMSGSIDGKVRIWGVSKRRVVEWADVRDIVTAICYQPDGQGFIVGSITGNCRFYDASGNHLQLDAQICISSRRKTSGNSITGIQFAQEESRRVMITSEDSKIRIFDGIDVIHKYRGLRNSGSQMSASFTSTGKHIISVGEDSRVYIWNYENFCIPSSKQAKSVHSCEHFLCEGVSVAIPWSGMEPEQMGLGSSCLQCSSQTQEHLEATSRLRDSERFSLGGWFSTDGSSRASATWPEEKLPSWAVSVAEHDHHDLHHLDQQNQDHHHHNHTTLSATWGLVILTAGLDGVIRTFHNYGLPVRL